MQMKTKRITHCVGTAARWSGDYLIALFPLYCWAVFAFGAWSTHLQLSVSLSASMVFTLCMQLAVEKRITYSKLLFAAIIGFTLGFLMPPDAPMWYAVLGAFLATVPSLLPYVGRYIAKYLHPVAFSLVVLMFIFPGVAPSNSSLLLDISYPVTPLASVLDGFLPEEGIYDLLLGRHGGLLGEVSVLLILVGGIYLCVRKVISFEAPLSMLVVLAVLSYMFPVIGTGMDYLIAQMLTGGIFFSAVFLLPFFSGAFTRNGRLLYGVLGGILTYVFRRYLSAFDGVFLAILLAGVIVRLAQPLIYDRPLLWKREF